MVFIVQNYKTELRWSPADVSYADGQDCKINSDYSLRRECTQNVKMLLDKIGVEENFLFCSKFIFIKKSVTIRKSNNN